MKHKLTHAVLALCMIVSILAGMAPRAQAAVRYDVNAMVSYAASNWDNGNEANGCAAFVSNCLKAGGIPFDSVKKETVELMNYLLNNRYATKKAISGTKIEEGTLEIGDAVIVECTHYDASGRKTGTVHHPHVYICTGKDAGGKALMSAHSRPCYNTGSWFTTDTLSWFSHPEESFSTVRYQYYSLHIDHQTSDAAVGASSISIQVTNGPSGSLTPGAAFYFRGGITSNYSIVSATVQIKTIGGAVVQEKTVYPNKTSVDILADGLDSLKFGALSNGSYLMYLTATDSSGKTAEWTSAFSVGEAAAASTLSFHITNGPGGTLKPGEPFYFRGSINSNYAITAATVEIRNANDKVVQQKTVQPNKTSVDILADGLDSLKFGELPGGSYKLCLSAKDSSGNENAWSASFAIGTGQADVIPADGASYLTGKMIYDEKDATITDGVRLEWTPVEGIRYYRVYRAGTSGGYSYPLTDFAIEGTSFVDVKLMPNQQYYYIVRPLIDEGNAWEDREETLGPISNEITVTMTGKIGEPVVDEQRKQLEKCYILMQIDNPVMEVNGVTVEVDPGRGTAPTLKYSRTVLPIRAVAEAMSGSADWNGSENKVMVSANDSTVEMWLGSLEYTVNGTRLSMDIAPLFENNRTFLPLRFTAENLNCKVTWINATMEILIVFYGETNA